MVKPCLLLVGLVVDICEAALATVLPVKMCSHEDTSTTVVAGTLSPQASDLPILIHLVELEHGQLDLLLLVLVLLGSGVVLLLALLGATTQTEHQVQCRLLLDVVVRQGAPIFQLLAGKDETLLVRGNALLVLDFGLHILDGITGFDLKSDGLARESLHEDLHGSKILYRRHTAIEDKRSEIAGRIDGVHILARTGLVDKADMTSHQKKATSVTCSTYFYISSTRKTTLVINAIKTFN